MTIGNGNDNWKPKRLRRDLFKMLEFTKLVRENGKPSNKVHFIRAGLIVCKACVHDLDKIDKTESFWALKFLAIRLCLQLDFSLNRAISRDCVSRLCVSNCDTITSWNCAIHHFLLSRFKRRLLSPHPSLPLPDSPPPPSQHFLHPLWGFIVFQALRVRSTIGNGREVNSLIIIVVDERAQILLSKSW